MGQLHKIFDHLPLPKGGYYYDEGAVANLLSLGHITKEFTVIMNTEIDDAIYIFNDEGQYLRFGRVKHNLYGVHLGQGNPTNKCYMFSTVQGQKSLFSDLDCKRAGAVRDLQERLGFPSDVDFANAIEYNVLGTCEYNRQDIRIANKIFGPSHAALKGKWTKRAQKMDRIAETIRNDIPSDILSEYRNIHLDIDIMYVNKIPFFTAISQDIRFIHCRALQHRKAGQVLDTLKLIKQQYRLCGFQVVSAHGDNEFAPLKEQLLEEGIILETCDTDAHVPTIERTNRFLKERIRCIRSQMPFKCIPKQLTIKIVNRACCFLAIRVQDSIYRVSSWDLISLLLSHICP